MKDKNIIKQDYKITTSDREKLNQHKGFVVWLTGLSGSGKSTLANLLEVKLHEKGIRTFVLDGDNLRFGLNKDLSFTSEDRKENIRRISEVAKLMADAGLVVISAFITPFQEDRNKNKSTIGEQRFLDVFVDCPIEVCEERDVKGLYKKARAGEIKNFTGINSPFETPENPDLIVNTHLESTEESLIKLLHLTQQKIK